MYQALYQALDERRSHLDPIKNFGYNNALEAYKHIAQCIKQILDPSVIYRIGSTEYVKEYYKGLLLDIANTALYVVSIIDRDGRVPSTTNPLH